MKQSAMVRRAVNSELRPFGTRLQRPNNCPDPKVHPLGNRPIGEPLITQDDYLFSIEYLPWSMRRHVAPGPAMDRLANPTHFKILLVPQSPCLGSFPDQCPLEFRRRAEHVKHEPGCWIPLISIQSLRHSDKPNPAPLQLLNVVQAIDQGPPKPVQFPAE
jgi:hypothetical protein